MAEDVIEEAFSPHSERERAKRLQAGVLALAFLLAVATIHAQATPQQPTLDPLQQLSNSLQRVVTKVSPSIVQIEVSGYRPADDDEQSDAHMLIKGKTWGSGVILDSDGYIATNAHVVEGGNRIRVLVEHGSLGAVFQKPESADVRRLDARLIGIFKEADLAILKIEAKELPALDIADSEKVKQGQLVLAIGNPEGLKNSVSMGLISGIAREKNMDGSVVYLQTDAAINSGSSGGALVDVNGNLVGITTFILTEGGGSEGLGFALPSRIVYQIYHQIRADGRVHHGDIGARIQAVTPELAEGLHLSRDQGLIVADVVPEGPADKAGLKVQDEISAVDDNRVDILPQFATYLFNKRTGDSVKLDLRRGSTQLTLNIPVMDSDGKHEDPLEVIDTESSLVPKLGVVCAPLNSTIMSPTSHHRSVSGVLVAAKMAHSNLETGLVVGDIIHAVNGTVITTVAELRSTFETLKPGAAVALQIEHRGKLKYIGLEIE
jgi:serine protease Do